MLLKCNFVSEEFGIVRVDCGLMFSWLCIRVGMGYWDDEVDFVVFLSWRNCGMFDICCFVRWWCWVDSLVS